ncbi:hypothetical protein V5O48_006756 [Marasmius crinis-equi]|uniref:Sphingomyelin phosphodiesterase n=1 Tax=Marasmius crinis-equi TaxID=585013 RepID=A0ABR3FIL6_9AGAR
MPWHMLKLAALLSLLAFTQAAGVDDVLAALSKMHDCTSCRDVLVPLQGLARQGDNVFVGNFTEICIALKVADTDVCTGLVTRSGPILAHDLRQINVTCGKAGAGLCDALFGFCSTNASTPFQVPLPLANAKTQAKMAGQAAKTPFQVVHISDVHIDRGYTVGSEANCTKSLCCRHFADQDGSPVSNPAERNGNIKCDSPVSLLNSMLDAVNAVGPKFVIFTGDVVDHFNWLEDQSIVEDDLREFNADMLSKIRSPVFPTLGNHDTAPVNAFARSSSMTANHSQFVFDVQSAGWRQWIGVEASDQVEHRSGSYSARVPETNLRQVLNTFQVQNLLELSSFNLRILSVNTQYWYKQNFWLYDSDEFQPDPNGILAFLVQELQAAEDAEEKVWVIGHIPLGKEDVVEDQSNYYDQILQRYKDTISGHFFGHSHKDEFQIAYSDYDNQVASNAVSFASIGPALTPTSKDIVFRSSGTKSLTSALGGNPAFKVYDVDPDTSGLMNVRVVYSNISDPSFQSEPTWLELYNARDLYGPLVNLSATSQLTPAFWHNLTEVFRTNDTAFQLFNALQGRKQGAVAGSCDEQCRITRICDIRAFRSENNCQLNAQLLQGYSIPGHLN